MSVTGLKESGNGIHVEAGAGRHFSSGWALQAVELGLEAMYPGRFPGCPGGSAERSGSLQWICGPV